MIDLGVKNTEVQTDTGFFIINFKDGKSLACCLVLDKELTEIAQEPCYFNQIDGDDCGYLEGMCGDTNEWALDDYGIDTAVLLSFIIHQAIKSDVEVI